MTEKKHNPGQWAKGTSGNPSGRQTGEMGRLRALIAEHTPAIISGLVADALLGDTKAARLLLERALPPLRAEAAPAELPALDAQADLVQQGRQVLEAIARGELPIDHGASLIAALGQLGSLKKLDELEARLRKLEDDNP
jgi:hypothetical protein